jgi:cbb3-type cytochrome oxidase subunit 3
MNIDLNLLRSIATVLGFVAFLLLVWRVWRRQAQAGHEKAAQLPFLEDEGVKR